ncbi:MAG TPA: hypothetical protein V6D03_05635, partial [Candidatus Caenarcaniphilales bacterium]
RVMARSRHLEAPVAVQVSHQFLMDGRLKRRVQKRSHATNAEGMLVVIPFTQLKSGLWQLTCSNGELSEPGEAWQESVQLQVVPQDLEAFSEWGLQEGSLAETDPFNTKILAGPEAATALETTHENFTGLAPSEPMLKQPVKPIPLHLPTFNQQQQPLSLEVSAGQIFPPQLCQVEPTQAADKVPQLPVIPRSQANVWPRGSKQVYPDVKVPQLSDARFDNQATSVDTAFEALNLKTRFWSTLHALVRSAHVSGEPAPEVTSQTSTSSPRIRRAELQDTVRRVNAPQGVPPLQRSSKPLTNLRGLLLDAQTQSRLQRVIAERLTVPEIVPAPSLVVPPGLLIAGQPLRVCVRIPDQPPAIYVKLWVSDRQTQAL